jgi:hypothetical protein
VLALKNKKTGKNYGSVPFLNLEEQATSTIENFLDFHKQYWIAFLTTFALNDCKL